MEAFLLLLGFGIQIVFLGSIVVAVIFFVSKRSSGDLGSTLRRFFQQGLLLALVILVATGLSGLGAIADPDVDAGPGYVAFMLACLVVGGPTLLLVVMRARKRAGTGTGEGFPSGVYLFAAEMISLITAAIGASIWLGSLLEGRFDIAPAAVASVWGAVWVIHRQMVSGQEPASRPERNVLAGSLVGLSATAGFAVALLTLLFERAYSTAVGEITLIDPADAWQDPAASVVVFGAVWAHYWIGSGRNLEPGLLWRAYVLLAGVVGGLFTALVGVWTFAYLSLDWLVVRHTPAGSHFSEGPPALALVLVGVVVWAYHQQVLKEGAEGERSEVDRIHDYTVAGVGLVAAVGGTVAVIAAAIQVLIPAPVLLSSERSELMAAVSVLLVGAPLWWRRWARIQAWRAAEPAGEVGSPTRRIYLIAVFGIGGGLALISLLILVYRLLEEILEGALSADTFGEVRLPLALVLTVGLVAFHHRTVRRADLPSDRSPAPTVSPIREVTLVARSAAQTVAELGDRQPDIVVRGLQPSDRSASRTTAEEVLAAVRSHPDTDLLLIARVDGLEVIPTDNQSPARS